VGYCCYWGVLKTLVRRKVFRISKVDETEVIGRGIPLKIAKEGGTRSKGQECRQRQPSRSARRFPTSREPRAKEKESKNQKKKKEDDCGEDNISALSRDQKTHKKREIGLNCD